MKIQLCNVVWWINHINGRINHSLASLFGLYLTVNTPVRPIKIRGIKIIN